MFYLSLILFTLIFLIIACISDLKSREISNKLILFFLIFGIILKLGYSIITRNYSIVFGALLSLVLTFVVFYILWELGVIAGGDFKLFLVLSILIPNISMPFNLSIIWFPAFVFVISLFMLLPWIIIYSIYFIVVKKYYLDLFKLWISKSNLISMGDSIAVIFLISLLYSLFSKVTVLILLFASFVFTILIYKIKNKKIFYSVILGFYSFTIVALVLENQIRTISLTNLLITVFFVMGFSILGTLYKIIKEKVLIEVKALSKLKEGDLPLYNYYYKNKKLKLIKPTVLTKIKMLLNNTYYLNLKIDSSKACGITKEDILFLKGMYKNNLISSKIYLKKTLAFVPAVLLAYILIIII